MTPERLRAIRAELGLTQLQLARALGVTGSRPDQAVIRWEAGSAMPPLLPLAVAALRAGLPPAE